mmetsp:Transcript_130810/g.364573  ORF Transcript_130810/g.364573 Transcript_130810/m.364573 type:complete len:307 (+) Transcript_130810:74-994(+)
MRFPTKFTHTHHAGTWAREAERACRRRPLSQAHRMMCQSGWCNSPGGQPFGLLERVLRVQRVLDACAEVWDLLERVKGSDVPIPTVGHVVVAILVVENVGVHERRTANLLRALLHFAVLPGLAPATGLDPREQELDQGHREDLEGALHGVERLAVLDVCGCLAVLVGPVAHVPAEPPGEKYSVGILLHNPVVRQQLARLSQGLPSLHEDPRVGGAGVAILCCLCGPQCPADDLPLLGRVVVLQIRPAETFKAADQCFLVGEDGKVVAREDANLLHVHLPDQLLLPPALLPVHRLASDGLREQPAKQ